MKYLCERCGVVRELGAFRVEGETLVLTCALCGTQTRGRGRMGGAEALTGGAGTVPSASASASDGGPPTPGLPLGPAGAGRAAALSARSGPGADTAPVALGSPGGLSAEPAAAGSPRLRVIPFRAGPDPARLAAEAARKGPFDAPPDRCPKCIAPKDDAGLACAQCGLVYVNFEPASVEPSRALGDAWCEALRSWDDPGAHERFLRQAEAEHALATAGRLYRIRLESAPDDPVATRGRDEVLRRAALPPTLATQLREVRNRPPAWQFILLGVLVLFAAVAMYSLFRQTLR